MFAIILAMILAALTPVPAGGMLAADGSTYCQAGEVYVADSVCASVDTLTDAPACLTEDQETDCYWDATRQGNGEGRSFAVVDGAVIYLD